MSEHGTDATKLGTILARVHEAGDDVAPDVKEMFGEIRETLRVPFVGAFFRTLASDPPLLRAVWSALRGPLGTRYAEKECDRLRAHALFVAPDAGLGASHRAWLRHNGIDERTIAHIARVNETVHYAIPKYLLAAAAAAAALRGETVGGGGSAAARGDGVAVGKGEAPGVERAEPVPPESLTAAARSTLERLRAAHGHPFVPSYFRLLARWPAYLERAASDLSAIVGTGRHAGAAATLATLADVATKGFPEQVRIEAKGALSAGDAATLAGFFHERLLPDLLIDVAYLRALLENERRARTNGLSATCA